MFSQVQEISQLINTGGVIVLLIIGILVLTYGAYKEWWISGPLHRRITGNLQEERDAWRSIALGLGNTAERSVQIAEQQLGIQVGKHA